MERFYYPHLHLLSQGERRDKERTKYMKKLPKQYNFRQSEEKIYQLWEESGLFQSKAGPPGADNLSRNKKYCNILPPPNANGELHLGHASGYTVMDIFGRFERMKGKKVLLLPGKDHAGIQTQVVFERKLKEERGITRHDLGQDKFYEETYAFCIDRANYMRAQEKRIGISADWSREKFTLDSQVSRIALETFVKMHRDGLVYRGRRIINWCPRCVTALSDIEVIHKEEDGKLYCIKYPIKDEKKFITVATTRPETMLGDTAVAVNPEDARYEKLIGKMAILPLRNREIPIIADKRVDQKFGTGAVKITPAHDPLDWEIGHDHTLSEIQVINEEAKITSEGGAYAGQDVLLARENILRDLKTRGFLEKEEDTKINKSVCERCKTTIEPLISKQWFVNVDAKKYSLKKEALKAVKDGKIKIYPERFRRILIHWYDNLRDWCVSRQIWWGHRIPVWYCEACGEDNYIVSIEKPECCPRCKSTSLTQESDTFDTWFSSGQWPYSTLGYPKHKDYKTFYPTDMMIMGRDILFLWASRMIMMGIYRTGKIPFENLYLTGLVRDKEGYKMSKSRGNGIDPLAMMNKFGADALRLSLVMDVSPGQDSRIYEEKIESFRNFVTKLWNIFRYAAQSDESFALTEKITKKDLASSADQWIVSRLNETIEQVGKFLENKNINLAQETLRRFTWEELADWYVETNKVERNTKVLGYVLNKVLHLWHPFMPFVTEEIYQTLSADKKILMTSSWPKADKKFINAKAAREFNNFQDLVVKIRNVRASYHIDPSKIIEGALVNTRGDVETPQWGVSTSALKRLARIEISTVPRNKKMLKISSGSYALHLDLADLIDVPKELARLLEEKKNLEQAVKRNQMMLKNKNFVKNAPVKIVKGTKEKLEEYESKLKVNRELTKHLKSFII